MVHRQHRPRHTTKHNPAHHTPHNHATPRHNTSRHITPHHATPPHHTNPGHTTTLRYTIPHHTIPRHITPHHATQPHHIILSHTSTQHAPRRTSTLCHITLHTTTSHKFLGLIFDTKLSFVPHIKYLKRGCLKVLAILRVLSSSEWGADKDVLLAVY